MHARIFNDEELLDQVRNGLTSGFEGLVERYYARCLRLALGIMRNREDAEEAVQDAFLRVYRGLRSFRRDAKFSTWLYRIMYNVCYTGMRKKRSVVDVSVVEDRYDERLLNETASDTTTGAIELKDEADKVIEILHELPERYQTVLHLYYLEEFSVDEIAGIMHIGTSSVKVRLHRGRALLRDEVYKRLGERNTSV
jgi:RNA polymerase sigma factor (sigma-70 family)